MSTLLAILTFASAEGEAEPSKVPYYVMGIGLALWAVLVAGLGIKQHDFPSSEGAARAVMAISTVLVLGVMASTILTS